MTDRPQNGDDPAVPEHRRHDGHVEQVSGADPRIVGDQDVAGRERLGREPRQDGADGAGEGEVEDGHRPRRVGQRVAPGVQQLAGEVLRFADDEGEGRSPDREPALLDDVDEPAPHDLQSHRVGLDPRDRPGEVETGGHDGFERRGAGDANPEVSPRIDLEPVARQHHRRGLTLLDDGGADQGLARGQRVPVVHRRGNEASGFREVRGTVAFPRGRSRHHAVLTGDLHGGGRPGGEDAPVDRLDHGAGVDVSVESRVLGDEGGLDGGEILRPKRTRREPDRDVVDLSEEAHLRPPRDGDVGSRHSGLREEGAPPHLEVVEEAVHRPEVQLLEHARGAR